VNRVAFGDRDELTLAALASASATVQFEAVPAIVECAKVNALVTVQTAVIRYGSRLAVYFVTAHTIGHARMYGVIHLLAVVALATAARAEAHAVLAVEYYAG